MTPAVAIASLTLASAFAGCGASHGPGVDGDSDIDADTDSDTDSGSDTTPILDCPGGNVGRIEGYELPEDLSGGCGIDNDTGFDPPYELGAQDRVILDFIVAPHPPDGSVAIGMGHPGNWPFQFFFSGPPGYVVGSDGLRIPDPVPYDPYGWNVTHADFRLATGDAVITVNGVETDPLPFPQPADGVLDAFLLGMGLPCGEVTYLESFDLSWVSRDSETVLLDDDFDGPIDDDDIPAHWNVESVPPPAWLGCPPVD